MSGWDQFSQSSAGPWEKLSRVAVPGAEYDSPERSRHPKCLAGTRVRLLQFIHELLDRREKSSIVWLHGTAGVGKSAVAFTVAERMKALKVTEETNVETRLAGTFFFSREQMNRSTTSHFIPTLAYQLASNFPSVREHVNRAIRENPAVLDSSKSLRSQVTALFRQPLRHLQIRLRECAPPVFVVDALDESKPETVADLISLLGQALRDPDLPVIHILLTSRSEEHIRKAIQKEEMRPLVCEIPVNTSGEGIAATISLDGEDVDNDIYSFLQYSFTELRSRHPDFPQPTGDELTRLANRAGRRFIVATTMMKFIDDGYNDPRDRLELMLELTHELLPGTEVFKLYNCILSTCSDPSRAYQHLSIVAALADPLPISQISKLLGPGHGSDVTTVLVQLRSFMDVPADSSQPVNIYHSSIRDYVLDFSNCSLPGVQSLTPPHSLLAYSSFRLMIRDMPERTALMDALSELKSQSQAMEPHNPQNLQQLLAFIIEPPEPLRVLTGLLWLRGTRGSGLRSWLETLDGRAWLQTQDGEDYLQTQKGANWLETRGGSHWLQTHAGNTWLQTEKGRSWLQSGRGWLWSQRRRQVARNPGEEMPSETWNGRDLLETIDGQGWLETPSGREWLQTQTGGEWLQTQTGGEWLQSRRGEEWLQTSTGQVWLQQTPSGRGWLETQRGREWLQTQGGGEWLVTTGGREWLHTLGGREWLQTPSGREWVQTPHGQEWLCTKGGREWLRTEDGQEWLHTLGGREWLQAQGGREWLQTPNGREWAQTLHGRERLDTESGREWLRTEVGREWLQAQGGREWLQTPSGREWVQALHGQEWLGTKGGREWLRAEGGRKWLHTPGGREWLLTLSGREWLQTPSGREWVQSLHGREWVQSLDRREWVQTLHAQEWLGTKDRREGLDAKDGQDWLCTKVEREWLCTESGREWLGAESRREDISGWLSTEGGQEWLGIKDGKEWLSTEDGRLLLETQRRRRWQVAHHSQPWLVQETQRRKEWPETKEWLKPVEEQLETQSGREWLKTSHGQEWLQTQMGQQWLNTSHGQEWLQAQMGQEWLQAQMGQEWSQTQGGREWLQTPIGQDWLNSQSEHGWLQILNILRTPIGLPWLHNRHEHDWLHTWYGREWLLTQSGREWLLTQSGEEWLSTLGVRKWLDTLGGREWLQTKGGREWLQTQSGREWLQTSHGQAWQLTPAASVWVTMEDFSNTLETISECAIIPQLRLPSAFQAIQVFKSLPDYLMFPAFLALRPQSHSTPASLQDCPDIEVIHAMTTFTIFANEARNQSRAASDALKYAGQNWVFHLSRASSPTDARLNCAFKVFWDRYLLSWLERQWCLRGLRSCLLTLSEGQKLAQERLIEVTGSSQSQV